MNRNRVILAVTLFAAVTVAAIVAAKSRAVCYVLGTWVACDTVIKPCIECPTGSCCGANAAPARTTTLHEDAPWGVTGSTAYKRITDNNNNTNCLWFLPDPITGCSPCQTSTTTINIPCPRDSLTGSPCTGT